MSKFLLQSENGVLSEDVTTIRECISEHNWLNPDAPHEIKYADLASINIHNYSEYIPVGSIEFVEGCLTSYKGIDKIQPILIPEELSEFAGRQHKIVKSKRDLLRTFDNLAVPKLFVKSASKCKRDYTGIYTKKEATGIPDDTYFVSDVICAILSEWRVFVYSGEIIDLKCYEGCAFDVPDKNTIKQMISAYKNCPPAYTLDVAVINTISGQETLIVEVHNFISCGLYGLHSRQILPMLSRAYNYEVQRNKERLSCNIPTQMLCAAKRKDNGKWVEGYYIYKPNDVCVGPPNDKHLIARYRFSDWNLSFYEEVEIDINTLVKSKGW